MKFQVEIYKKVIQICKDSDIEITFTYIEGCQRLPLGRNATNTVTVKFVNRKNSKASGEKIINTKSKAFAAHCLYPY